MASKESAMVVLSGGQDSTLCLGWAKRAFKGPLHAISFNYGQRHDRELESAKEIAKFFEVDSHEIVSLGNILKGRSPLVNKDEDLEQYTDYDSMTNIIGNRVELTFVPMRNALFLTLAANRAVCSDIFNLVTGVCEADTANYPDCREVFISAQQLTIEKALGLDSIGGRKRFIIHTPLIALNKAESVRQALSVPGVYRAWAASHTAYDGQYPPTGNDHATLLRAHGFSEAGYPDPLIVRAALEDLMELPDTENYNVARDIVSECKGNVSTGLARLEDAVGAAKRNW